MPAPDFATHVARLASELHPCADATCEKRIRAFRAARDAIRRALLDACASVERSLPSDADPATRTVLDAVRGWACEPAAAEAA